MQRSSPDRPRVAVLCGGRSAEHEVSLLSAANLCRELQQAGYPTLPLRIARDGAWLLPADHQLRLADASPRAERNDATHPWPPPWSEVVRPWGEAGKLKLYRSTAASTDLSTALSVDLAFPIVHGPGGEDGSLQGFFELLGVPYVGPDVLAAAVSMDKDVTKRLLQAAGLPVLPWRCLQQHAVCSQAGDALAAELMRELGPTLFVKPTGQGSSVGVTRVTEASQLDEALATAFAYDARVLVERASHGRELEIAVLGRHPDAAASPKKSRGVRASLPGEISVGGRNGGSFYSYAAKYLHPAAAELHAPAEGLSATLTAELQNLACRAFEVLCGEGLARVDFFLEPPPQADPSGAVPSGAAPSRGAASRIYLNEVNSLPGFTQISMYPRLWQCSGVSYAALLDDLIAQAWKRHQKRERRRHDDPHPQRTHPQP